MKLFFGPGACSAAIHIALEEIGKPYESERVDLRTPASKTNLLKANPKGAVPTIITNDGHPLTEGAVILQYLADTVATPGTFLPKAGTWERFKAMEWLNYVATEMHKGFSPLFHASRLMKTLESQEELKAGTREVLGKKFDYLVGQLGDKDYILGDFSFVDCYLATTLSWSRHTGLDLAKWPTLQAYLARVAARPAAKIALEQEGIRWA